jgi:hypothetical protein
MPRETRSTTSSPVKSQSKPPTPSLLSSANPPRLLILPEDVSPSARIVTLTNPHNSKPCRYFFCPLKGLYEFTNISAQKRIPRSFLITPTTRKPTPPQNSTSISSGYTTSSASVLVATPYDPLFLLLPALFPLPTSTKASVPLFQPLSDYVDILLPSSPHLAELISHPSFLETLHARAKSICDTVEAGDETMYRLSTSKLLTVLLSKATRACDDRRLPASLEAQYVRRALDVPIASIRREESSVSANTTVSDTTASQDSETSTSTSTESQASTAPSTQPPSSDTSKSDIPSLQRLSTTLFLLLSYTPPHISSTLTSLPLYNEKFSPLQTYLTQLSSLRKEALAARSLNNNVSLKRTLTIGEEEAAEVKREKRRKVEDDEKRAKKGVSRAVKQLGKADVTGMKKLSAFFGKKAI